MSILLNNRHEKIAQEKMSLEELIQYKKFTFHLLVTKINNKLVKKEQRANTFINDGDDVLVLHMISGG